VNASTKTTLRLLGALLVSTALLAGTAGPPAQQSASSAAASSRTVAEKLKRPGLPNLGCINEKFYRGGQPEKDGFQQLQQLGVDIVVNLREGHEGHKEEKAALESLGIRYVAIPWAGLDYPKNKDVATFLRLLRDNPDKRIFVHCRRGAERTGVMVAAYRMAFQGWTPEQALEEMEQFKFRGFWFRHLKRYVRSFPEQLRTDPDLKALVAAPEAAKSSQ
jgi:protein tyrosine/serine phosphatase